MTDTDRVVEAVEGLKGQMVQLERGVHSRIGRLEGVVENVRGDMAGFNRELGELSVRVTAAQRAANGAGPATPPPPREPLNWKTIGALITGAVVGLGFAVQAWNDYFNGGG